MTQSATSWPEPLDLIDQAIEDGDLEMTDQGLQASRAEELQADLRKKRDERKLASLSPEDDSSAQEQVILGWALAGEQNNTRLWARFRSALGLEPLQEMPVRLWSSPERSRIAYEAGRCRAAPLARECRKQGIVNEQYRRPHSIHHTAHTQSVP